MKTLTFRQSMVNIMKNAIPSVIALLFEVAIEVVSMSFAGHLNDPIILGGVGMGMVMMNVFCLGVSLGLSGAIDTLVS